MSLKNSDGLVFCLIVIILIIGFLRLIFIDLKVRRYVKKYHRNFWENNISFFWLGGRTSIFQIVKKLDDPILRNLQKDFIKALKQLLLVVVTAIMAFVIFLFGVNFVKLLK